MELGLSIFPVSCQKGKKNRSSHRFKGVLVPYRRCNLKWVLFVLYCILYWCWVLLGKVTLSHNVTPWAFKPSFGWNSDKYFLSSKDQLGLQPSRMALEILFLFFLSSSKGLYTGPPATAMLAACFTSIEGTNPLLCSWLVPCCCCTAVRHSACTNRKKSSLSLYNSILDTLKSH